MSRGTRIRGVIRVAIAGTAQDNAISPNAVQEAINRHFTLLGDTASQYGGTVEHLSGSERLYLFLDGPKTVGAANAILAAAVRINAMRPQSEPSLLHRIACDYGSTTVEERLLRGQARTFTSGDAVRIVEEMIELVPAGQVWATQSLLDEAAKFGHTAKVQPVQSLVTKTGAEIPVVQVISLLSEVSTATTGASVSARKPRKQSASPAAERLLKNTVRLAILAALAIGAYVFVTGNPKMFAGLQKQLSAWTKSFGASKPAPKKAAKKETPDSSDSSPAKGTVTMETKPASKPSPKPASSKKPAAVAKNDAKTIEKDSKAEQQQEESGTGEPEEEVKNEAEENPNADPSEPPPDNH